MEPETVDSLENVGTTGLGALAVTVFMNANGDLLQYGFGVVLMLAAFYLQIIKYNARPD